MFHGNIYFLGNGKWRYKLIAYTSVLAAVTESKQISHVMGKEGLRILLADLQMAFMNRFCKFKKQNRELPYASNVRASRVKYKLKKDLSR